LLISKISYLPLATKYLVAYIIIAIQQTASKLITISHTAAKIPSCPCGAVLRNAFYIMFAEPTKITNRIANRVVSTYIFYPPGTG
jgi:hypothetical protein